MFICRLNLHSNREILLLKSMKKIVEAEYQDGKFILKDNGDELALNDGDSVELVVENITSRQREQKQSKESRKTFNTICAVVSIILAIASILIGIIITTSETKDTIGQIILSIWVIAPPIFFWIDWIMCENVDSKTAERAKHNHDLARNIWLGFIVLLAVLFDLEWPGS